MLFAEAILIQIESNKACIELTFTLKPFLFNIFSVFAITNFQYFMSFSDKNGLKWSYEGG